MKRSIYFTLIFMFLISINEGFAQGNAEAIAKEVIKAYKNEDADLLKKHASGMVVHLINDGFFESDGKPLVEIAQQWNGKIKEIRYTKGDMMGSELLLASAYFGDNPNGNLNVVILSSLEKADWKAFALGITDVSREEFEQGATSIEATSAKEAPKAKEAPEAKQATNRTGFSTEMANGDMLKNPSDEQIKTSLQSLNDDNFFMTLEGEDGFLQTTISGSKYIVQYSDDDGMFEAEEYFTLEQLIDIFIAYINKQNWKEKASWNKM
jgi:hypothetical protein